MHRPIWILLAVLAALALPPSAVARPLDALRGAKLQSATGTLTISETRCAQGSTACGTTRLNEKFDATSPRTRSADGRAGFSAGLRVVGRGTGQCYAETPAETVTGPDGSVQFIGSSARLVPGAFGTTRLVASSSKRGVRIAWLEPLTPGINCDFFGDPETTVAVPAAQELPDALISPLIGRRALKRSRFGTTIAGSQKWTESQPDGTQVNGQASWRLKLTYVR